MPKFFLARSVTRSERCAHPHRRHTRKWSDDYWTRTRTRQMNAKKRYRHGHPIYCKVLPQTILLSLPYFHCELRLYRTQIP